MAENFDKAKMQKCFKKYSGSNHDVILALNIFKELGFIENEYQKFIFRFILDQIYQIYFFNINVI